MSEDRLVEKLIEEMKIHFPTKGEINRRFDAVDKRLDGQDELFEQILASTDALDKVLEQYPVARIERIEKHLNLPRYVHYSSEE